MRRAYPTRRENLPNRKACPAKPMGFFCDTTESGGRGRSPLTPACTEFSGGSPAAGVPLEIPDDADISVRPWGQYRAKMFIPCVYGRCPGRMQLRVAYTDNSAIERPYYLCDQDGGPDAKWECPKSHEPTYPETIRTKHLSDGGRVKPGRKSNERVYRDEMETML